MKCPHCGKNIPAKEIAKHFASKGGSVSSEAKTAAARANAKKPRKRDPKGRPQTERKRNQQAKKTT